MTLYDIGPKSLQYSVYYGFTLCYYFDDPTLFLRAISSFLFATQVWISVLIGPNNVDHHQLTTDMSGNCHLDGYGHEE